LAKALHTIEDSYAPGHARRQSGTYLVEEIYYWPDVVKPRPGALGQPAWPGHEALDDPSHPMSREFQLQAKRATGDLIAAVLTNLEKDAVTKTLIDVMYRHFANVLK